MCDSECISFVERALTGDDIAGKRIIEIGSHDVNGSVRAAIEARGPASYVGVDIMAGPSVDVVLDASLLLERFDPESFDVVLSTEMAEHVRDWRTVFINMKTLSSVGGVVVLTTRSPGFAYHAYPNDFWRYELSDMALIFADFDIEMLESERDRRSPGVFVKARRTRSDSTVDLSPIALHSIFTADRRSEIPGRLDRQKFLLARRARLAMMPVSRYIPEPIKAPFKKRLWL